MDAGSEVTVTACSLTRCGWLSLLEGEKREAAGSKEKGRIKGEEGREEGREGGSYM